ncbi:ABC transporter permease [Bariatricus massiliensis]|uniref:Autoinducer 2 import system permease protein LsrD n=1 Tax=Bariatricus massiliensis TaxID=1745713 RepID=A0ABS8DMG1_9FIRM|nr:ABC transporter permease [Bariatricus massiliensis]MCB7305756.1 ABC transporter permease [Bariatricus massiliensis]MCB7376327.1 ABC transporter permease [Bariatricus massiliensis]MCB7388899.1 ABC transporter permease [Bariatricus massiliensis]MCB7413072.1 ABC transporter permease [Bariatricus massiliensis]MCQ5254983.1 ABC transporter permease [Bariatricus massiliensis]
MGKEASKTSGIKRILNNPVSGPYIALVVIFIISAIASPQIFPTYTNVANILRQASIVGVVSIGMTVVLLVGGIDLSVTSIMAICACVLADMMEARIADGKQGIMIGPILIVLLIGCLIGLVNGILIVTRNLEPFIITLGVNMVVKGITMIYTKGAPGGKVTEFWANFGSKSIGGVPYAVLLYAVMMAIFMVILHKTVYGRHIYAIGSNAEAARLTGIKVKINKVMAYVLCGFTAALAGVMLMARVRVGEPNGSTGYDMDALAAAVIGGTSMGGGIGSLAGTLAGVLIMAIMNNILNLVGADPNLQGVIKGGIILIAVLIQRKND